jgi:organic radical activating enzyme
MAPMKPVTRMDPYFAVNWAINNGCNNRCSYCPPVLHEGSTLSCTGKLEFISKLQGQTDRTIRVELSGGEPTLAKDFLEFLEGLKKLNCKVGLVTNAHKPMTWWRSNKHLLDYVQISYHSEYPNEEHVLEVIRELKGACVTHVNVIMYPPRFDQCLEFASKLRGEVTADLQAVMLRMDAGDGVFCEYTPEQMDTIVNQERILGTSAGYVLDSVKYDSEVTVASRLIARGENSWVGYLCYIGVEQLAVDWAGRIRRGWCRQPEWSLTNFKLPTKPVVCTKPRCHCGYDIRSTKTLRVPVKRTVPMHVIRPYRY